MTRDGRCMFFGAVVGVLAAANAHAQDSVTGVVQNATSKLTWVRTDAESGNAVPVVISRLTLQNGNGVYRYSISPKARVTSPTGERTLQRGDLVEVSLENGQVSGVTVLKLTGIIGHVDTKTNISTETLDGQAIGHREATCLTLKGRHGRWEVASDAKITSPTGEPAPGVHEGDTAELTFTRIGDVPQAGRRRNVVGGSGWEIVDVRITKAKAPEAARQFKLTGVVTFVTTADVATDVRYDRVPGTPFVTEKARKSQDFTSITLKDKGTWHASSAVKIAMPDGKAATTVHVGDEVELTIRAREIEAIRILKPAATGAPERWSTTVTGTIDRINTSTVPVEMHNGDVTRTRDVTHITMRDTGETWELSHDVKIQLPNGTLTDRVHDSDEVELTMRGKLVTEVKILRR